MTTETALLSAGFQRLYCDAGVYASFSGFHPISFARVLPFQPQDAITDNPRLISAEEAHLARRDDQTRREVIEAFVKCDLLSEVDADNVKSVIDYYDADFFELMGSVYASEDMYLCALRWYREFIHELENQPPEAAPRLDSDGVYPSVGYCLYSLGLYPEAISWSKSCIGPGQELDLVCRALIGYEAQQVDGTILAVERVGPRARYIVGVSGAKAARAVEAVPRLKTAIKAIAPFEDTLFDLVELRSQDTPPPEAPPEGYPFRVERDAGDLPRHKMNLIFAVCGQADALVGKGCTDEAKRLLFEALMLEPNARFVWERIEALL